MDGERRRGSNIDQRDNGRVFILDTDPEYVRDRLEKKQHAMDHVAVFGDEAFDEKGEIIPQNVTGVMQELRSTLEYGGSLAEQEARIFLAEGLRDREIIQDPAVLNMTRNMPGHPDVALRLLQAFREGNYPQNVFAKTLMTHRRLFEAGRKDVEQELPELRAMFIDHLKKLTDDPTHPLKREMIPDAYVERRVDEVGMTVADPLVLLRWGEYLGEFNDSSNSAAMFYNRPSTTFRKRSYHHEIYNHEMLHAISGRGIVKRAGAFQHVRIGLRYRDPASPQDSRWLNEAVTETLTQDMELKGRNYHHGSYIPERQIFRGLLRRIPEELFLSAYFENARGQTTALDPNSSVEVLENEIDQAYGRRHFLAELSDLISQEGAEEMAHWFGIDGNFRP